jgi:choline dehydrogenase-like flavoprotein
MVDGHGRLHAVPNVYVVDSSVFTTGPEKNPTLTAMAIAVHAMAALAGTLG